MADEMVEAAQEEWELLDWGTIYALLNRMGKCLDGVIAAEGRRMTY